MQTTEPAIDLLTAGEALIRLSVPAGELIAATSTFDIHIGGAESNVAVALAHLGYRARWLSRLTDNVLGHRIASELTRQGVDCSNVIWTPEDRVGLYFIEFGALPRPTQVTYDRSGSAASKMNPTTFDLAQVPHSRVLHLTGITAALSEECYALVVALLDRASKENVHVVFDVNFRARLWSPGECAARLTPLFDRVNTLLISQQDANTVFAIQGDPQGVIFELKNRFGIPQIALTLAESGALGLKDGVLYRSPVFPVQIVDRIGAGDAFAAGVICGVLRDDFELGLRYGVAMSALKLSLNGDMFQLGEADITRLLESQPLERPLR